MAKADLTAQRLRELLHYDCDTGVFTHRSTRSGVTAGQMAGWVHRHGYRVIRVDGARYLAVDLVWLYLHGEMPEKSLRERQKAPRCSFDPKQIQVSPVDQELLTSRKWSRVGGYVAHIDKLTKKVTLLHRLMVGAKAGEVVDHINGDKLDNRRENLRICTHGQNLMNRAPQKNNSSGFRHVRLHKNRWCVEVVAYGVRYRKFGFVTPEDAHVAALELAAKVQGEFASHLSRQT